MAPFDVVVNLGYFSHVELVWEDPAIAHSLRGLTSFRRLILFDRRGLGLSDPIQGALTLEDRMQDLRAVMGAAGSERTALFGLSEGGLCRCSSLGLLRDVPSVGFKHLASTARVSSEGGQHKNPLRQVW